MKNTLRLLVAVITWVAVYDIYCTVKFADSIPHCEENPFALWFVTRREVQMYAANPRAENQTGMVLVETVDVSRVVLCKSIGIALAVPVMWKLIDTLRPTVATAVIVPVFLAACWLLARLAH